MPFSLQPVNKEALHPGATLSYQSGYHPAMTPMPEESSSGTGAKFQKLVEIMARLRAPGGCPWDREQTFDSIKPYTLEETYEVLDAVDRRDWDELRSELGDFMLQAVFFAQMAAEEKRFDISDSLDAINEKLIRRHPHVFADETAETGKQVLKRWDEIKAEERKEKKEAPQDLLATVPRALPALVEAQQITSRASRVGFDWHDMAEVLGKLEEEIREFEEACVRGMQDHIEDEVGDLLFTIVNLARFVKVDPEQALRRTNTKFRQRFGHVERRLAAQGKQVSGTAIEELEALWQEAKS
jgi:MazG family protein